MFYLEQLIPHIVPRKTSKAASKYLHQALLPLKKPKKQKTKSLKKNPNTQRVCLRTEERIHWAIRGVYAHMPFMST